VAVGEVRVGLPDQPDVDEAPVYVTRGTPIEWRAVGSKCGGSDERTDDFGLLAFRNRGCQGALVCCERPLLDGEMSGGRSGHLGFWCSLIGTVTALHEADQRTDDND